MIGGYIEVTYLTSGGTATTKILPASPLTPQYEYISSSDTNANKDRVFVRTGWAVNIDFQVHDIAINLGTDPSTVDCNVLSWIAYNPWASTLTFKKSDGTAYNVLAKDNGTLTNSISGVFDFQIKPFKDDTEIATIGTYSGQFRSTGF
jgi:hypothetical protein